GRPSRSAARPRLNAAASPTASSPTAHSQRRRAPRGIRAAPYTARVTDYPTRPLPRFVKIAQELPRDRVEDVVRAVRAELGRLDLATRLPKGAQVAITAGSRGIADIPLVIGTVVQVVRELGGEPFIVPAMGSHGGATTDGQRHVLAEYGITEQS